MRELSILIPSRNEEFLRRTVEDILSNIEADTEIIVVLDGYQTDLPENPRLRVIYNPESIGQRAATNQACKLSNAKYVMKVDAHCAFDKGFDRKMIEKMQDDYTMIPVMRNLHAFNWVCPDGHRRYQSPSGPCKECNADTVKEVVWIAKTNPQSTTYCFDSEPHFQYFNDFKRRPEYKDNLDKGLTKTMSIQGSCFMLTRDKYWELNISDEAFGSWGSQGIEVSMKTRLSGGKVMTNHQTWYAHMFRTQGGDFGFPYPQSNTQVENAKKMAKEFFFNNKWSLQIYPISSVLEEFWPVTGWNDESLKNLKEGELKTERSGVYSIKNKISEKIYVGSAVNLARRFGEHLRMLHRKDHENRYLQSAWNKYGEDKFIFVIEYFCKEDDLVVHEQRFIDSYKEKIGWRKMYNMNPMASSALGRRHTLESIEKMSKQQSGEGNGFYNKSHTQESIEKMRDSHIGQVAWNKGKPWSEEIKEKIGLANTGKVPSEETKKKISENSAKYWLGKNPFENSPHPKGMLGKVHDEETKLRISQKLKGRVFSEEELKKNSAGVKNSWIRRKIEGQTAGIVYYTDNRLDEKIMKRCQEQLKKSKLPIVSVSLQPINFGYNITLPLKRSVETMFKQILAGLERLDTDVVFLCEHDVLYHPTHFDFRPEEKDIYYYNYNVWQLRASDGHAVSFDARRVSQLCADRKFLVEHYKKRIALVETVGFSRHMGFEPGMSQSRPQRVDDFRAGKWRSEFPNIDIKHGKNLTEIRWKQSEFNCQKNCRNWKETDEIEGWGKGNTII